MTLAAPAPSPTPRNVLIIKPSSLGDVVSALPIPAGIKRSFPDCRVSWLVTPACADILANQGDVDEVILFDRRLYGRMLTSPAAGLAFLKFCRQLKARRFDWVLDLQGLFRSGYMAWQTKAPLRAGFADAREAAGIFYNRRIACRSEHTIDRSIELARAVGVDARAEDFHLHVDPAARQKVEALLAGQSVRPGQFVLLFPGTRWQSKTYPARLWREVAQGLARDWPVVLAGGPAERELCQSLAGPGIVDLAAQTNLRGLSALISLARLVICCDSSANFLSPAVGTPHLVLLGPTRPERTGPYGPLGRMLRPTVDCLGCLRRRCWHDSCMQWIAPADVISAAREMMAAAKT